MTRDELIQILKKIEEAKSYFLGKKVSIEDLDIAENIFLDLLDKYKKSYTETNTVKYMEFKDMLEFMLTINTFKFDKKVEWTDFPVATIYFYLQYISFEKKDSVKFFKYAERAFNYAPLALSSQFETAEIYKNSDTPSKFKSETFKIYQNIFSAEDLSRFYRNLGYYYTDKKNWHLGFALYLMSLNYQETNIAISELDYIRKALGNPQFSMNMRQIEAILDDYNIPIGISENNLRLLEFIYEKETATRQKYNNFNQQISKRLLEITKNNKYMMYSEIRNDELGLTLYPPFTWHILSAEEISKSLSADTIYAFQTESSLIGIKKGNRLGGFSFDDACNLNIFNNEKIGYKYESHELLVLNLENGPKEFRRYLYNSPNDKIYIVEYLTVINDFIIKFTTTATKYEDIERFNNQRNILSIMTLLFSIKEDEENLAKDSPMATQEITINNKIYKFKIPEMYPNIKLERNNLYKIGEDIFIYIAPKTKNILIDCAKDWMDLNQKTSGFVPMDEIQSLKIGKYQTIKRYAQKQNHNTKSYKFLIANDFLVVFVYEYKNNSAEELTTNIIETLT